jgi:Mg/Co/Ni transporter MgtE
MEPNPVTIRPEAPVSAALDLMEKHSLRFLAVVEDRAWLVGALTDRDLWWTICQLGEEALHRPVHTVMDPDPPRIDIHSQIEDALLRMCEDDEPDALAVVSHERVVGIMTRQHVLSSMLRILGSDRAGSRVDVALLNKRDDLACAFEVLRSLEVDLLSATAGSTRDDGADPVLSMRFADGDARPGVERAMARAGLLLLVPEHERVAPANGNGRASGIRILPSLPAQS